jgi:hypothetical protein
VGGQIEHARNDLFVRTYGTQFRAKFSPNVNTDIEVGFKYEKENLKDNTNEWKLVDSAGYSIPRPEVIDPRTGATGDLKLAYYIAGKTILNLQDCLLMHSIHRNFTGEPAKYFECRSTCCQLEFQ